MRRTPYTIHISPFIQVPLIPSRRWLYFTCAVLIGSSHQGFLQAYRIPMDFLTFPPIFLSAFPCYLFQATRLSRSGIKMPDFWGKVTGIRIRGLTTFFSSLFFFFFTDELPSKLITLKKRIYYVCDVHLSFHTIFFLLLRSTTCMFFSLHLCLCVCVCVCLCVCVYTAQGARGWSNMFSYPGK